MRIAIFTNNYLPNPFGVAVSIESFRKELEKCGHTVYIFAPKFKGYVDKNPNVFRFPSVEFNFSGIHFPLVIPYSYKISRILEKLDIDIVHSQHPNLLGWEASRWAKKKKIPLVFTWHTLYDKYTHFAPFIPEKFAAWWTIGNAVKYANNADQIIIPTDSVKEIIQKWGVKNKNIATIPTGIEEEYFRNPDRNLTRKKLEILDDEISLLLLCRITAEKNVIFLAKAVKNILKKNKKVKFILAGDGVELENMKKIFSDANVENQVIYVGMVGLLEKKNIYAAGDIFVHASKSETQGLIISEAMYAGLAVVAVNATGIRDIIKNGETGFLVNENEDEFLKGVQKLIDEFDLRKKFSENSRKIALENYTSEKCTQKILPIYEKILRKK
jgi:glycosyltransferase involved in cell wall biosynthesis